MTSFTRKRGQPPRISDEERRRLAATTAADIEAAASLSAESPPLSQGQLQGMATARFVRRTRELTGLSQAEFASRFGISIGRLRDYEQGRFAPDAPVLVYLRLIAEDPTRASGLWAQLSGKRSPTAEPAAARENFGVEEAAAPRFRSTNARISRHHIQWAAQFEVAAELCKRGCDVSFTMGEATPLADLMVLSRTGKMFLIDVKGQSSRNFWRVRAKPAHPSLYYVLILVGKPGAQSEFYPMSQQSLRRLMDSYAARPTIHFDERFSGFNWGDAKPYRDRWSELPLPA